MFGQHRPCWQHGEARVRSLASANGWIRRILSSGGAASCGITFRTHGRACPKADYTRRGQCTCHVAALTLAGTTRLGPQSCPYLLVILAAVICCAQPTPWCLHLVCAAPNCLDPAFHGHQNGVLRSCCLVLPCRLNSLYKMRWWSHQGSSLRYIYPFCNTCLPDNPLGVRSRRPGCYLHYTQVHHFFGRSLQATEGLDFAPEFVHVLQRPVTTSNTFSSQHKLPCRQGTALMTAQSSLQSRLLTLLQRGGKKSGSRPLRWPLSCASTLEWTHRM